MKNLRGTYVHRGDAMRARQSRKRIFIALGFVTALGVVAAGHRPAPTDALAAETEGSTFGFSLTSNASLRSELETTKGQLDLLRAQMDRADRIISYSGRFNVPADIATPVYDIAQAEGIDPELAFRLVSLESDFNPHARSPVGAIGLTQVMPSTAHFFDKNLRAEHLADPKTNLRIGFRYLRTLMHNYNGNVKLALLAYNRGEVAVARALKSGVNPTNGYDRIVMKGYKGKGIVD